MVLAGDFGLWRPGDWQRDSDRRDTVQRTEGVWRPALVLSGLWLAMGGRVTVHGRASQALTVPYSEAWRTVCTLVKGGSVPACLPRSPQILADIIRVCHP